MKKKILVIALAVMAISLVGYGTLAWFTSQDTANNTITTGDIEIQVNETMIDDGEEVPYVDPTDTLVPGTTSSKIVCVENTGSDAAYVRVKLDVAFDDEELSTDVISLNLNTTNWTYSNGYYYYNSILQPGDETEDLFDSYTFSTSAGNEYASAELSIDVNAYAVQSDNNGTSALTATGWPTV
ncbi:MAG: TasA family protein [Eubacteriales bacterium]